MRTLKSIREDLKVDQKGMAKLLGISYPSYALKEQGKTPLLAREHRKISDLSGVPENEIEIPC